MIKSALQSSLTNDIKHRSMSAGAVPSSEYLIQTYEVGATLLASVTFDNLGQYAGVYKHLQIVWVARSTDLDTGGGSDFLIQFNNNTGSNYSAHRLDGSGSSVVSTAQTSQTSMRLGFVIRDGRTANSYSAGVTDILDPFSASKNTTVRNLDGYTADGAQQIRLSSGLFFQTSAINTIKLFQDSFSFKTGSRFSLYGVTA